MHCTYSTRTSNWLSKVSPPILKQSMIILKPLAATLRMGLSAAAALFLRTELEVYHNACDTRSLQREAHFPNKPKLQGCHRQCRPWLATTAMMPPTLSAVASTMSRLSRMNNDNKITSKSAETITLPHSSRGIIC